MLKSEQTVLLAKNFDWMYGHGYVIKNPRGLSKSAFPTRTGRPAQWAARYGSITFNQNGKEMPYGGINEKGLTVEMLWMDLTNYGEVEQKEYLNELEWIQYQLDNYATVQEVLDHINERAIHAVKGKIHYIVADSTGQSVIIEFLNQKVTLTSGGTRQCQAISNHPAQASLLNYQKQPAKLKGDNGSHWHRFNVLQRKIDDGQFNESRLAVDDAFDTLKAVAITKGDFRTYWSIVYDATAKVVYFRTAKEKAIKHIALAGVDFSDGLSGVTIDVSASRSITNAWQPYTQKANAQLVHASFKELGLEKVNAEELSAHQFQFNGRMQNSFTDNYTTLKLQFRVADGKLGLVNFAIMRDEEQMKRQQAIPGGANGFSVDAPAYAWVYYGLPKGKYAVGIVQDENRNRRLDLDQHGKPSEKYAFSNAARVTDGKFPSFQDAAVNCRDEDSVVQLEIE